MFCVGPKRQLLNFMERNRWPKDCCLSGVLKSRTEDEGGRCLKKKMFHWNSDGTCSHRSVQWGIFRNRRQLYWRSQQCLIAERSHYSCVVSCDAPSSVFQNCVDTNNRSVRADVTGQVWQDNSDVLVQPYFLPSSAEMTFRTYGRWSLWEDCLSA